MRSTTSAQVETQQRIGRVVKIYARARGISIQDVATALSMSKQSLYERFRGQTRLGVAELQALAEILGTTEAALLADPDEVLVRVEWVARDSNPEPTGYLVGATAA